MGKIILPVVGVAGVPDPGLFPRQRCKLAKAKILVMDDEDLVRNVAGKMLDFLGYQSVGARDGREAVQLYESHRAAGAPFDAVILDLLIPGGMGGAETLSELLRIDPAVKALISSGYGDQAPTGPAAGGHVGVISKPYELKKLGTTIEEVLSGRGVAG